MSFYGTLYSEIIDAIYRVLVSNEGKNIKTFPTNTDLASNTPLTAIGRQGVLDMNSGNRWIQLTADSDETKCSVWHAAPDSSATKTLTSFEKTDAGTDIVELSSGDIIKVSAPMKIDAAGHVYSTDDVQYYKMPVLTVEQDIDDLKEDIGDFDDNFSDTTITDELLNLKEDVGEFDNVFQNVDAGDLGEIRNISEVLKYLKDAVGPMSKVYADYYLHSLSEAIGDMYAIFPTSNSTSSLSSGLGDLDSVFSALDVDSVSEALLGMKNTMATSSDSANNANICIGGTANNDPGNEKLGGSAYFISQHPDTNISDILTDLQNRVSALEEKIK